MVERQVLLVEAYAYEIDAIERSENARHRKNTCYPDDHWFCPNPECRIPVVPKQSVLGNCFYAGHRTLHNVGCAHYNEPTDGDGTGEQQRKPSEGVPPFIPNVLGQVPTIERIHFPRGPLSPQFEQALAYKIKHAERAPISGTLEEVVNAYNFLPPSMRKQHSLSVQGTHQNYESAFVELDKSKRPPNNWKSIISVLRMRVAKGKVSGYYFLVSPQWLTVEGQRGPTHVMLSMKNYQRDHPMHYFSDLLRNSDEITAYFTNVDPQVFPHRNIFKIDLFPQKAVPRPDQLALRAVA